MLTITSDGNAVRFYINRKLTGIVSEPNIIRHSMGKLIIGQSIHGFTTFFYKGMMDELRMYNYELSAKDIMMLYGLRDKIKVTATKTKLEKKEWIKLSTTLYKYLFTSPTLETDTGANIIVVKKGLDNFSKGEK